MVLQSATSLGRTFQQFITWWEKQFCLIEVIALGLSSFHLCPLVGLSFRVKNKSKGMLLILLNLECLDEISSFTTIG